MTERNERIAKAAVDIHKMTTGRKGTKASRKPVYQLIVSIVKEEMHRAAEVVDDE